LALRVSSQRRSTASAARARFTCGYRGRPVGRPTFMDERVWGLLVPHDMTCLADISVQRRAALNAFFRDDDLPHFVGLAMSPAVAQDRFLGSGLWLSTCPAPTARKAAAASFVLRIKARPLPHLENFLAWQSQVQKIKRRRHSDTQQQRKQRCAPRAARSPRTRP
jgi:hypothetical protein